MMEHVSVHDDAHLYEDKGSGEELEAIRNVLMEGGADLQEQPQAANLFQAPEEETRREAPLDSDRENQLLERQRREQDRELQLQLQQLEQHLLLQHQRKQVQRQQQLHQYSDESSSHRHERRKHKSRERHKRDRSYERPKRDAERESRSRRHRSRESRSEKDNWENNRHRTDARESRRSPRRESHSGSREDRPRRERPHIGQFELTRALGRGAFGTVYEAYDTQHGGTYAIKRVNLFGVSGAEKEIMHREIQLLQRLRHRHVVKYVGAIRGNDSLNIILEYCQRGAVTNVLNKEFGKHSRRPEEAVASCAYQVLLGLAYLHERGVIHRDIKGANILMNASGVIKLADFGVATRLTGAQGVKTHSVVGTPYWMAPEIIQMNSVQSPACDVWSVGCTIIELLTGRPPFYDLNPMTALYQIVRSPHPPLPQSCSQPLLSFLHACFERDPQKRPSVHELLTHPWLSPSSPPKHQRGEFGLLPELEVLTPSHPSKMDSSSTHRSKKYLGFDVEPANNNASGEGSSSTAGCSSSTTTSGGGSGVDGGSSGVSSSSGGSDSGDSSEISENNSGSSSNKNGNEKIEEPLLHTPPKRLDFDEETRSDNAITLTSPNNSLSPKKIAPPIFNNSNNNSSSNSTHLDLLSPSSSSSTLSMVTHTPLAVVAEFSDPPLSPVSDISVFPLPQPSPHEGNLPIIVEESPQSEVEAKKQVDEDLSVHGGEKSEPQGTTVVVVGNNEEETPSQPGWLGVQDPEREQQELEELQELFQQQLQSLPSWAPHQLESAAAIVKGFRVLPTGTKQEGDSDTKRTDETLVSSDQPLLDMREGPEWGSEEDISDRERGLRYYSRQREYKDHAAISNDWATNFHNSKYSLQYNQNIYYNHHSSYFRNHHHHHHHHHASNNGSPWLPHHSSSKREDISDHRRDSSSVVIHAEDERHDSISSTGSVVSRYPKDDCDMWRADDRRNEPESCSSPRGFSFRWRPEAPWGSTSFSQKARDEEEDDSIGSTVIHHSDSLSLGSADDVRDSSLDHSGRHDWQLAVMIGRHHSWLQQQQHQQQQAQQLARKQARDKGTWERGASEDDEDIPHGPSTTDSLSSERLQKGALPPPGSAPPANRVSSLNTLPGNGGASSGRYGSNTGSPKAFSRTTPSGSMCRASMRSSVRPSGNGSSGWNPRPSSWGARLASTRSGSFSPRIRGFDETEIGSLNSGRNRSTSGGGLCNASGSCGGMPRLRIETEMCRTRSASSSTSLGGSGGNAIYESPTGSDAKSVIIVDDGAKKQEQNAEPVDEGDCLNSADQSNNMGLSAWNNSLNRTPIRASMRPPGDISECWRSSSSTGAGFQPQTESFQAYHALNDKKKSKVTFALPHSTLPRRPGHMGATLQPPPPSPPSTPSPSMSPQAATVATAKRQVSASSSFSSTTSVASIHSPAANTSSTTTTTGVAATFNFAAPVSVSPARDPSVVGETTGLIASPNVTNASPSVIPSTPPAVHVELPSPDLPPPPPPPSVPPPDGCGCGSCVLL